MNYPIWDISFGGPMLMALVAVTHVIVSHFAIGGGLVIAVTETLAVKRGDREMRELARRSSLVLILFSTVFGAISGVGIWVVAGLIAPGAISALIHNYVWGWAIEWVFFLLEIVAALVYYNTWGKIGKRTHVMVGWLYFVTAYLSLVVINGIITFQLTPGEWLTTHSFWDGFFNPTYWPALVLRTGITLLMAASFMVLPALKAGQQDRPRLVRYLGWWLLGGVILSAAGYLWWEAALPDTIRHLFLGASPDLATLAQTRSFLLWALAATLVLGSAFLLLLPKTLRSPLAILIMLSAFAFFAGYERLREGTRKPFLIHDFMFSNGILVQQIPELRESGILASVPWAARGRGGPVEAPGQQVFRAQCSSCHTIDGYQGIRSLLPEDPDMIYSVLYSLYDQAEIFADLEPGEPVDMSELAYPFMPPFAGTEEEMEMLLEYLTSLVASEPEVAVLGGVQ